MITAREELGMLERKLREITMVHSGARTVRLPLDNEQTSVIDIDSSEKCVGFGIIGVLPEDEMGMLLAAAANVCPASEVKQ